jgi:uncharacterized membrane protein
MTEPVLVTTPPKRRFIPELRSPWWTALLVLSLMANLVVAGAAIGAKMKGGGWQLALLENRAQLLPRKFFAELPRDRRRELMEVFKAKKDEFVQGREAADAVTLKFADLLEQPDFDQTKIKAVVDDFTSGSTSFATQAEAVIMDIAAKLTPDERKKLAADIRDRAARRSK